MSRLWPALLLPVLLLASVGQAQQPQDIEDLRPENQRFDNLGMVELPIGPVPSELLQPGGTQAEAISDQIFGPRIDAAYGAYQRGYYLTALDLALPRAEQGDRFAQTLIAEIYANGLGITEDLAKAAGWYRLASEAGDPLATFELALLYNEGRGVPKDRRQAAALFRKAAEAGNVLAKYNLGLLHVEGIYAEPSLTRAAALLREAAEAGVAEARYDYAGMLMEGAGVAPDPAGAAEQFRLAAEAGLVAAQIDYATLLYLGRGVPQDRGAAASWYQRAALSGSPVAQNRYAKLLAVGEGVAPDLETAAMWRALARRQGLTDPQLDRLLSALPAERLAAAEERARFWPSAPPTEVADNAAVPTPDPATPLN